MPVMGHFVVDPIRLCRILNGTTAPFAHEQAAIPGMNHQDLLEEISDYCRKTGLAESTFGRRAVNDGKLAARLRDGGRITTYTLDRIRTFMDNNRVESTVARPPIIERPAPPRAVAPRLAPAATDEHDPQRNFRFF